MDIRMDLHGLIDNVLYLFSNAKEELEKVANKPVYDIGVDDVKKVLGIVCNINYETSYYCLCLLDITREVEKEK